MHLLQTAVATDSYSTYLQFSRGVKDLPAVYLRDLLEFNYAREAVPIDEVEAITENPQALRDAGHVARRALTRGA
jgi:glutamate synthase (NADPH/NADH) large chain